MKKFILKSLADLRFAISILLLIALLSIIGTIIEQDQPMEVYKLNYPKESSLFGFLDYDFILTFGLDHVYKTYWFIFLIIIFGLSLLSCTYLQQLPSLNIARRCQFFRNENQFKKLKIKNESKNKLLSQYLFNLNNQKYSIFLQHKIIYAYKGLIGRIAPIIVHISMIFILIGSICGSIGGFNAQEIVPKGEIFNVQNVLSKGFLTKIPNRSARINDFWITYNKQTTIEQFYSNISFLNKNGQELNSQTLSVNHPAKYKGLTFYQTDWNLIGLRFKKLSNIILQYPLILFNTKSSEKVWISWVPLNDQLTEGVTILVNNLQGYVSVYDKLGNFQKNLELNDSLQLQSKLTLLEIIPSTGLQIKIDPGLPIIYLGFGFLMLSTLVSYTTYSQIWLIQNKKTITIGGNTNRAKFDFLFEFENIASKIKNFSNNK